MVKEIFEIEPIQKNSIIVMGGLFCLSYLQLNIFDNRLSINDVFHSVVISLALSICWFILNSISTYLFFEWLKYGKNSDDVKYDRTVLLLGYISIVWVAFLTYIGYEIDYNFKEFIRLNIVVSIFRIATWGILLIRLKYKEI